MFLATVAGLNL